MPKSDNPQSESVLVSELKRKLQAKEKTIQFLVRRVDELSSAIRPSLPAPEGQLLLEQVLAHRTAELDNQHKELGLALTELKVAQTQLLHTQKLEAIGSLAAGIAHEINTPTQYASDNTSFLRKSFSKIIVLLEGYKQLVDDLENGSVGAERIVEERDRLRKAKLTFLIGEIPNALDGAFEGLGRIRSIVKAMKAFSHRSNGLPQLVDLKELIDTTVTVTRNEWKYVAELKTDFDPKLPPIPCLRDELSQVLVNLIVNSAYAIGEVNRGGALGRGSIRIETHLRKDCAEISVIDNGGGIPVAVQQRVFEPFFTTKPVGRGTGQGLAIAYSVIVDKHRGKIHFTSVEGEGTTFKIWLPLREEGFPSSNGQEEA